MGKLQRMIDTNRLRTDIPVDVTQLMATGLFTIKPLEKEGGIMLQDDVRNLFSCSIYLSIAEELPHLPIQMFPF